MTFCYDTVWINIYSNLFYKLKIIIVNFSCKFPISFSNCHSIIYSH